MCFDQVDFVNEEAYAQCTNDDYYLDAAQYKVWPHLVNGSFRFFGSGFAQNQIKSAAIKQGNHRYFSSSLELVSDNEIHVEFGDLSEHADARRRNGSVLLLRNAATLSKANGVPACGWQTALANRRERDVRSQLPQITDYLNSGSGKDGTWQNGDTIKVAGKNILYPVPTATKLVLKGDDGVPYVLENPRLPDDWYTHHYDNDNMALYFTVPDDLSTAKISGGSRHVRHSRAWRRARRGGLRCIGDYRSLGRRASCVAFQSRYCDCDGRLYGYGPEHLRGRSKSVWLYKKVTMAISKPSGGSTDIESRESRG